MMSLGAEYPPPPAPIHTHTQRGYVHREIWLESLKKGDIYEDLGVDSEIILKWV
jgi:hypothetical protein